MKFSNFARLFPSSLGSFQLKQKLSNFRLSNLRLSNLKLSNLSFFLTALSNYTYPGILYALYKLKLKGDNEFQQDNLNACISQNEKFLGDCILECKGDAECKNDCVTQFENNYSECPCQVILNLLSIYDPLYILSKEKCPYGCPCDGYDCEISQKKSVLVLYTRENSNQPVLIKADG